MITDTVCLKRDSPEIPKQVYIRMRDYSVGYHGASGVHPGKSVQSREGGVIESAQILRYGKGFRGVRHNGAVTRNMEQITNVFGKLSRTWQWTTFGEGPRCAFDVLIAWLGF